MNDYPTLVSPLKIGNLSFKNRIVMPPMVIWKSGESAEVQDIHLRHYASCAGPGLMIVEATTVSADGKLHANQLGIFDDRHVEGLKKLAQTISETGAVPGIQIHHAGGRSTPETNWGLPPVAPSTDGKIKPMSRDCRVLTREDILRIQDEFAAGAARAVEAGFKYIEIHGAHGYLGCQFLSPLSNTRTDEYGGSLENRQRFLIETYRKCRKVVGDAALLSCRLGVADHDMVDGLSVEDGVDTARRLEAEGAPILNISSGHKPPGSIGSDGSRFNPLMQLAGAVKAAVSIPVIGIGGIFDPADAEAALTEGMADMIAVARGTLADPQWAAKTVAGKADAINTCLQCRPCKWFSVPEKCPTRIANGNVLQ